MPLAEEGIFEGPLLQQVFELYLKDLKQNEPDVLMLGCTHYPLFRSALQKYLPNTRIIDSAQVCADMLGDLLDQYELRASPENLGKMRFYVTDYSMEFSRQTQYFLGDQVRHLEKVQLDG